MKEEYYIVRKTEVDGRTLITLYGDKSETEVDISDRVLKIRIKNGEIKVRNAYIKDNKLELKRSVMYKRTGTRCKRSFYIVLTGVSYGVYEYILGEEMTSTRETGTLKDIDRFLKLSKRAYSEILDIIKVLPDVTDVYDDFSVKQFKVMSKIENNIDCEIVNNNGKVCISNISSKGTALFSIPEGVEEIESYIEGINIIETPSSLKKIGDRSFRDSDDLYKVICGKGLEEIGNEAFSESNLRSIEFNDSILKVGICAFMGSKLSGEIKCNAYEIGNGAFGDTKISKVVMKRAIRIGKKAFMNNNKLKEVDLGDRLEFIGKYAFSNCKALKSVVIPRSCKYIDSNAFYGCRLKEVWIPKGLEYNREDFGKAKVITY